MIVKQNEKPAGSAYDNLSDKAKDYLEMLKKKFGNVDFFIGDVSGNNYADATKEYSCTITPDLLEKMATDSDTAAKYEGIIEGAAGEFEKIAEAVGAENKEDIAHMGITVSGEGVNYYVLLKESMAKKYEDKDDGKTEEADKAADKKEYTDRTYKVEASSLEELIALLKEIYKDKEKADKEALGEEEAEPEILSIYA